MAVFNKNTLAQVSGFDNPILAGELVWDQQTYWNLSFTSNSAAVDLTGATLDAQIVRRQLSNIVDTRNGLTFDHTEPSAVVANLEAEIALAVAGTGDLDAMRRHAIQTGRAYSYENAAASCVRLFEQLLAGRQ